MTGSLQIHAAIQGLGEKCLHLMRGIWVDVIG